MTPKQPPRLVGTGFTVLLLGLIALAAGEIGTVFQLVMLLILTFAVATFHLVFRGSGFFAISLANFLGVYACFYVFFVVTNFYDGSPWSFQLGFSFPILAFLGGAVLKRAELQSIVQSERLRDERHLGRTFLWLLPVSIIGALTFLVPEHVTEQRTVTIIFLAAMASLAFIVFMASRDIAVFLLDSGLLFEEFFQSAAKLLVPAFAFFTFYSLQVIVFGCIYRILDRFTEDPLFLIGGEPATISFSQALYFSVITLSTVGYGDVVPLSDSVRVIVSIQIVSGVLLLLFGFSEIIAYTRNHKGRS